MFTHNYCCFGIKSITCQTRSLYSLNTVWISERRHGEGEGWKQVWFQLPQQQKSNVFCLVKLVWQPVPEGGCGTAPECFYLCSHKIQRHSVRTGHSWLCLRFLSTKTFFCTFVSLTKCTSVHAYFQKVKGSLANMCVLCRQGWWRWTTWLTRKP